MNTYLIYSESYHIINDEIAKIIGDSLNVIKYDLRKDSLKEVIEEANYYSLTGEHKYIVLKCHNLFKNKKGEEDAKDSGDDKLLLKYLENPSSDTTLILVTYESPDKRKKLYKEIASKGKIISIEPLDKKSLTYKCMDILKSNGYKVGYDCANYIIENSYINYDIMINELEKIFILLPKGELTIQKIKDIISKSVTNKTFNYINAIMKNDLKSAIEFSKDFEVLKIEPVAIITLLAKEFETLYMVKTNKDLLSLQKYLHKENWQMNNYIENKDNFTINEIKKIIIKLNDYDYNYKTGLLDKSVIIDLITIDLCE